MIYVNLCNLDKPVVAENYNLGVGVGEKILDSRSNSEGNSYNNTNNTTVLSETSSNNSNNLTTTLASTTTSSPSKQTQKDESEAIKEDRIRTSTRNTEKRQLGFFSKYFAPIFLTDNDMEKIKKGDS